MNRVEIVGNLTKEPVRKMTKMEDGYLPVTTFTVAVNRRRAKTKGVEDIADYIPCAAFAKTADAVAEYCHKGMKVAVTGKIRTGSYIDKNGVKSYSFDVAVDEIEFLGARPKDTESGGDDNIQQQEDTLEQQDTMPVTDSSNEDMMR